MVCRQDGEDGFREAIEALQGTDVSVVPLSQQISGNDHEGFSEVLRRLVQMAPAEELKGAFRLPWSSFSSPCCIRKNTDPRFENPDDLILPGHDQEPFIDVQS